MFKGFNLRSIFRRNREAGVGGPETSSICLESLQRAAEHIPAPDEPELFKGYFRDLYHRLNLKDKELRTPGGKLRPNTIIVSGEEGRIVADSLKRFFDYERWNSAAEMTAVWRESVPREMLKLQFSDGLVKETPATIFMNQRGALLSREANVQTQNTLRGENDNRFDGEIGREGMALSSLA